MAVETESNVGKIVLGVVVVGAVGIGGYALYKSFNKGGNPPPPPPGSKGTLKITLSPSSASLKLANVETPPGTYQLSVGKIAYVATAPGYVQQSGEVTIVANQTTNLNISLVATGNTGYVFGSLTITPADVFLGSPVQIGLDIVNNSPSAQQLKLHVDITEMGATNASPPGSIVGSFDSALTTVQSGAHWRPTFNWTAAGAPTGKWVVASLRNSAGQLTPNTSPNNPQIYKQEFQVLSNQVLVSLDGLTITPNTANYGQSVVATLRINYQGPARSMTAQVNFGARSLVGGSFTIESGMTFNAVFSTPVSTTPANYDINIPITIPNSVPAKLYDVASRILDGSNVEVASRIDGGMLRITNQGVNQASVALTYGTITQGDTLIFSYSGYKPSAYVTVHITGSGVDKTFSAPTGPSGSGTQTYLDVDPVGNYTIVVSDTAGNTASATFSVISSGGGGGNTPYTTASYTWQGVTGQLTVNWFGLAPSSQVAVMVGYPSSLAVNGQSDASGSGSVSMTDEDGPGTYTVVVWDINGQQVFTTFTIYN